MKNPFIASEFSQIFYPTFCVIFSDLWQKCLMSGFFHNPQYLLNAPDFKIQAEENPPVQKSDKRLLIHEVHDAKGQHLITGFSFVVVIGSHWINTLHVRFAAQR